MDLTTLIGIVACAALIVLAIMTKEGAAMFINLPSIMIVFGGTVGATLVTYPAGMVFGVVKVTSKAFFGKTPDSAAVVGIFEELARKARREGLLSLQSHEGDLENGFFKKGLRLVVDGREADVVRGILEAEIDAMQARHKLGAGLIDKMGVYAPAFGMLGTIIGLIQMLQTMDDPSTIGPSMATALVTTFYGSLVANVVFIPLAGKLVIRASEESAYMEMLLSGFLGLLSGDDPHVLKERLKAMLSPQDRQDEEAD